MTWCFLWLLCLLLDCGVLAHSQSQFARLSFGAQHVCTYSYELVVHTARGSRSTESEGFQVHALVSRYYTFNNQCVQFEQLILL